MAGFSGCATILSERDYPVAIENSGGNTFFEVRDRKNQFVHQGVTPERVTLRAKSYPFWPAKYNVTFVGSDSKTQTKTLKAGFDPWLIGNIVVGGVPGAVVDGATGAMFRLPDHVNGDVPENHVVANRTQGAELAAAHSKRHAVSGDADGQTLQASYEAASKPSDADTSTQR